MRVNVLLITGALGLLALAAHINDPCGATNSCKITVKDSLGSSVTVTLPPAKY